MLRISGQIPKIARPDVLRSCRLATEAAKPDGPKADAPKAEAPKAEASKPIPPSQQPPPPPNEGGGGGVFGKLFALALLGSGGAVGYAWYDPKFRQQIEGNVPYSKEAFQAMFQYLPDQSADKTVQKSKAITSGGPISVDVDEVKQQSKIRRKAVEEKKEVKLSRDEIEKMKKEEEVRRKAEELRAKDEAKRAEENRIRQEKLAKEAAEAVENDTLERMLRVTSEEAQEQVQVAIEAQKNAAAVTKIHSQMLKKAMDMPDEVTGKEDEWAEVTKALENRQDAKDNADMITDTARQLVDRLNHVIKEGKENAITKKNKALRKAEETLNGINYDLNTAVAELTKAESEARVMQEYRDLVKKGKEQFKKELQSIMPDVKIGSKLSGKLSEEELNSLIAHAHRRIEQIQRQLLEQQVLEQQRIDAALDRQKEEDTKIADERVKREQQKLRNEFSLTKLTWDAEAQVKFEGELRGHLARQAAAHSDHLAEVLKVQERELEAKFQVLLGDRLLQERDNFQTEVAGWIARMKGIETAVEARADMEKIGRKAQELWLACQTLQNVIANGKPEAYEYEDQLQPLAKELMAIREAGNNHPFVNTVIETVPEDAVTKGVWTEEGLIERFEKVHRICRRVAMIDETGGTLFKYFLSYMQSIFVFASKPITGEVDLDALNTFKILDNAKFCMEKGELEQALRFMNQLRGESRKAARDWIKDVRLLLETRQAANALLAHASAEGLGSLV